MRRLSDSFPREPAPWRSKTGNHEHLFVVNKAARELKAAQYAAIEAEEKRDRAKRERDAERWIAGMRAAKRTPSKPNGVAR